MATELIINATLPETRIALMENGEIQELHVERDSERGIVGNIYKGKVIRVLPGMQAAFVDIGLEKAAFLYVDDIFFPDMKTAMATRPLPEGPIAAAPLVLPEAARGPRERGGGREREPRGRGGRDRDRGRGGKGGRGHIGKVTGPVLPGSPEEHARLQEEYGRLMARMDDHDLPEAVPGTRAPVAAGPAPEAEGESPPARSPSPIEGEPSKVEAGGPVPAAVEEDLGEEIESPVVYRPEPIIDPQAWEEELAEAEEGVPGAAEAATGVEAQPGNRPDSEVAPLPAPGPGVPAVVAPPVVEEVEDEEEDVGEAVPRRKQRRREPVNIADLVKEGQEILVQVAKDPIGTKGARLTCHVSLPGRYLVFMPTVDHVGVSRRIEGEGERRRLKDTIGRIRPAGTGVIVRTASGKQTDKKLRADLDYLVQTWNDIQKKFNKQRMPSAVYQDLTIVLRAIRDMFTDEVDKVVVDGQREHKSIMKFVMRFMPNMKEKVELYQGDMPIFDYFGIETEIERALERKVWLKSGGYLVVDQAEALIAIDVNTGRFVGKKNLEETILKTNLEAVKEIAYQLRLRNCGGIIILDLIDMEKESNREKVYKALEEALRKDRARPTIMKISQIGLIEMTRKRTRDSLTRSLCEPCSYCEGRGFVKSKFTISYDILRDIEREGNDKDTQAISIQCHPTVADVLLGDRRDVLENLEHLYNKKISVRANGAYHVEQYELVAHRSDKNVVSSSEERRQQLRQRIQQRVQERNQQLQAEQRKQKESERQRRQQEKESQRRPRHRPEPAAGAADTGDEGGAPLGEGEVLEAGNEGFSPQGIEGGPAAEGQSLRGEDRGPRRRRGGRGRRRRDRRPLPGSEKLVIPKPYGQGGEGSTPTAEAGPSGGEADLGPRREPVEADYHDDEGNGPAPGNVVPPAGREPHAPRREGRPPAEGGANQARSRRRRRGGRGRRRPGGERGQSAGPRQGGHGGQGGHRAGPPAHPDRPNNDGE